MAAHPNFSLGRKTKGNSLLLLAVSLMGLLGVTLGHAAGLFAASSDINVQVCSAHDSVSIVSPTDGTETRKSSIVVSGYSTAQVSVAVYRNNVKSGEVTSGSDGSYSISVPLVYGDNQLYARTTNPCGQNTDSNMVTAHRPTPPGQNKESPAAPSSGGTALSPSGPSEEPAPVDTKPPEKETKPSISEPYDGMVTASPTVMLRGQAAMNVAVSAYRNNQKIAEVQSDELGYFSVSVPLVPGDNTLVASYKGVSGELSSEPVTVTYKPTIAAPTSPESKFPLVPALIAAMGALSLMIGFLLWHHFRRPGVKLPPASWHVNAS